MMWALLVSVGIICFGFWIGAFLYAEGAGLALGPGWMMWAVLGAIFVCSGIIVRQMGVREDESDGP